MTEQIITHQDGMIIISWNLYGHQFMGQALNCPKEFRSMDHRFQLFQEKIAPFLEKQAIFFFQETCTGWRGVLDPFFAQNNYRVTSADYNHGKPCGLGIMIAYPLDYQLVKMKIHPPSTEIWYEYRELVSEDPMPGDGPLEEGSQELLDYQNGLGWEVGKKTTISKKTFEDCIMIPNKLICLHLRKNDHDYYIANYHMPCKFSFPAVMRLHLETAFSYFNSFVSRKNGSPPIQDSSENEIPPESTQEIEVLPTNKKITIFCGDLNLLPHNEYLWIIANYYGFKNALYPKTPESYPITIHSKNIYFKDSEGNPKTFQGTLDYILVADENLHLVDYDSRPPIQEIPEPIPNEHECSDHIPIGACLRF